MKNQPLTICLWYDNKAEQAVKFYTSVFKNSSIGKISRYGNEGFEIHQQAEGTVMTIEFMLNEMNFIALNGGPQFKFNEAISVVVNCETQQEIDYYWDKLSKDGEEGPCGWLKDKFGVSWQIVPNILSKLLAGDDKAKAQRVTNAFLQMKKFNIEKLINA